mgnify:CR=1 FL=1
MLVRSAVRHFQSSKNFGELLCAAGGIFGRNHADLQIALAAQRLLQRGNRFRLVVFDADQHALGLQHPGEDAAAFQHFGGIILHQAIVSGDIGLALGGVDNQGFHPAQAAAQLLAALPETLHQQGLSSAHINFTDARGDALLRQQPEWLMRLGCQYHWHNRGYRDFQDFLDTLMSRKRKQLRKERELVTQSGFEFNWYRGDELREDQWDFVYTCYANTYAVRGQRPYLTRDFFSLLAARMPHSIRVAIARLQQQHAAMAFCLVDGETLYGRYWGCLAEFDRLHFETCFYQGMDYAIATGLKRFDAGAQGEHKLVRGFEPQLTTSWHYLTHPGLRDAVADFLQEEREGVRAWADEARDALPYRRGD